MDINNDNFRQILPTLLKRISRADYVAIDCEMTGGVKVMTNVELPNSFTEVDKIYEKARMGAKTHNLVQLGITIIAKDHRIPGSYISSSWCFRINNTFLTNCKDDIQFVENYDRPFDFSASALRFHKKHGLDFLSADGFSKYILEGIPYLSRQEAEQARRGVDRPPVKLDLEPEEKTLKFCDDVMAKVCHWVDFENTKDPLVTEKLGKSSTRDRLCVQIIQERIEEKWPGQFVAYTPYTHNGIVIKKNNTSDKYLNRRRRAAEGFIKAQTGLRIIFEALVGEPSFTFPSASDILAPGAAQHEIDDLQIHLDRWTERIQTEPPVLVFHNSLHDLCFLHETFVGALPRTVTEFCKVVNRLFPKLVDTKIMALAQDPVEGEDPLAETFKRLQKTAPLITSDAISGLSRNKAHNAGYDSYMTAVIFLSLAHSKAGGGRELPAWADMFFDEWRNTVRIGRSSHVKLDQGPEAVRADDMCPML